MPVVPIPPKPSVTPSSGVGGDSPADAFARAAMDRAETTVALDATNQLQGLRVGLSDPDTGYRSLLGGDAVKGIDGQALTGHYLSLFDQGWKDISTKLMPGPQAMFDAAALNMRDDFARDLVKHEAEQGRVWRRQVLNTTVGNATGALIAGTGGNDAGYTAKARAALLTDGLGQGLSGEDLDKQTNFAFGRKVVEPVVTARLSQGDVAGARAFFDVHRDGMAADDADVLDKRLIEAGQFANTKAAVDDVWQRLGPTSFSDPIDWHAIENDLVVRHGGDDEALMRERDEVFHRILGFTQARDETHAGYINTLIGQVKGGASPSQVAALPQFLALPKDQQQQITDWHREQLADKLTGLTPEQKLDRQLRQFAAYHDLSNDDALKNLSVPQVQATVPQVGDDLNKQLQAQKQAADAGQTPRLDDITFRGIAAGLGIDPNPGPFDIEGKARLGVLRSRIEAAIAAAEAGGKTLTPDERQQIAMSESAALVRDHPFFDMPKDVQDVLGTPLPKLPPISGSRPIGSPSSNRTSHPVAPKSTPALQAKAQPQPVVQPKSWWDNLWAEPSRVVHDVQNGFSGWLDGFHHHSQKTAHLPGRTATSSVPDDERALLHRISIGEGTDDATAKRHGVQTGYDAYLGYGKYGSPSKPLSQMTLDEVDQFQTAMLHNPNNNLDSSAVGKYEIVRSTMRGLRKKLGLRGNELFDADMQDRLGHEKLVDRKIENYRSGRITESQFQENLAQEWASVAHPGTGRATQHTGTTTAEIQAAIHGLKKH